MAFMGQESRLVYAHHLCFGEEMQSSTLAAPPQPESGQFRLMVSKGKEAYQSHSPVSSVTWFKALATGEKILFTTYNVLQISVRIQDKKWRNKETMF